MILREKGQGFNCLQCKNHTQTPQTAMQSKFKIFEFISHLLDCAFNPFIVLHFAINANVTYTHTVIDLFAISRLSVHYIRFFNFHT